MKRAFAITTSVLIATALLMSGTSAQADATCTPQDAYDEIIIDQAYIPAVPGTPEIPEVPAVPEVPEISHTEYQRYSWTGGPTIDAPTEVPPSGNWQANTTNYEGAGHGDDLIGEPFQKDKPGKGNGDWFYWTATKVIDQELIPEVPAIPAVPAVPAIPAVAEVSHTVHHEDITCDAVTPPVVTELPPVEPEGLAQTGGKVNGWLLALGIGSLLASAGLLMPRKRKAEVL